MRTGQTADRQTEMLQTQAARMDGAGRIDSGLTMRKKAAAESPGWTKAASQECIIRPSDRTGFHCGRTGPLGLETAGRPVGKTPIRHSVRAGSEEKERSLL